MTQLQQGAEPGSAPERERPLQAPPSRRVPAALLVMGIVMVALNLRPTLAGFGPLLAQMQDELGASAGLMSMLTTVPVLLFGLLAVAAPWLTRWRSTETVLMACMLIVGVGGLLRIGPSMGVIMGGTLLLGAGIAVANVLLPGLVKRDFPNQAGLMTGVYTMALCSGAALASGLAVPLRDASGGDWRVSLGAWAGLAFIGAIAWVPALLGRQHRARTVAAPAAGLLRSPVAWQVTVYLGLQSLIFYSTLTWLPMLYQDHGLSVAASGWMLAAANIVQIPVTLALPVLAAKMPNQRALAAIVASVIGLGLGGLLIAPAAAPLLWALILGVGLGGGISLALLLLVLRAHDDRQVAQLSAMAQGFGYLLAATGPFLFGWLYDVTGAWHASMALLLAASLGMVWAGLGAGRATHVTPPPSLSELEWASAGALVEEEALPGR